MTSAHRSKSSTSARNDTRTLAGPPRARNGRGLFVIGYVGSQTRSSGCQVATNWTGGSNIELEDGIFSGPTATPIIEVPLVPDPDWAILGCFCFGFSIPADAIITRIYVSRLVIRQGSTSTALRVHQSLDRGATESVEYGEVSIAAGTAIRDYSPVEYPDDDDVFPLVSEINTSDFGLVLRMIRPPSGATPIGIDYLALTVEWNDPATALDAPVLTAETGETTAVLTWTEVEDATTYTLYESSDGEDGTYTSVYSGALLTHTVTGLDPGDERWYYVIASNDDLSSPESNKVQVITAEEPEAPTLELVRQATIDVLPAGMNYKPSRMLVQWSSISGAYSYELERATELQGVRQEWTLAATDLTATTREDGPIWSGGVIWYRVRTKVGTVYGPWSEPKSGFMFTWDDPTFEERLSDKRRHGRLPYE